MAKVIATERFVADLANVWSERIDARIRHAVLSLELFPEMGSPNVPRSIKQEFGACIRKIFVPPFDIVYTYNEQDGTVIVFALIPCKMAT